MSRGTETSFAPAGASSQSLADPAVSLYSILSETFTFYFINIRGFISHHAELTAILETLNFPTFVCLNETFLPGEKIVKSIQLPGYQLISRRDRPDNSGWGGIALFARTGYDSCIVHIGNSDIAERSWHTLHTDLGPVCFGLWYRPPHHAEVDTIISLNSELQRFGTNTIGTFIIGDLNVHEETWLKYSSGTSIEGRTLHDYCAELGLMQYI